ARHPDDENRIGSQGAEVSARREELLREQGLRALYEGRGFFRVPPDPGQAQLVALLVMAEGVREVLRVLERLTDGKVKRSAVFRAESGVRQVFAHGRELSVLEPKRLEIGETVIGFAERRGYRDGAPIGGNALRHPPRSRQDMPIARPDLVLVRVL